jgi:hypothetical protein
MLSGRLIVGRNLTSASTADYQVVIMTHKQHKNNGPSQTSKYIHKSSYTNVTGIVLIKYYI